MADDNNFEEKIKAEEEKMFGSDEEKSKKRKAAKPNTNNENAEAGAVSALDVNQVVAASSNATPNDASKENENFTKFPAKEGTFNPFIENVVELETHGIEEGRQVVASRCEGVGDITKNFKEKNENYKAAQSGYSSEASNVQELKVKHANLQRGRELKDNNDLDKDRFNTAI